MHPPADWLDKLNPQQREAVTTVNGPLLVIAGAGSGKTRVITHRIAHLIHDHDVPPWRIFAATFTNKAAEEMKRRVERLVPGADVARLAIATFHSSCVGILRREAHHLGLTERFTICDDTDQLALVKDILRNLEAATALKPEQALNWIGAAKIRMLGPDEAHRELASEWGPTLARVYRLYQERLLKSDAVDFDDLLLHVVRIFTEQPEVLQHYQERWQYVLVDEYQDTNRVQFELVRLLAERHGNLCVVGDEDQSIYSWRGAEIENLLEFPNLFEGTRIVRLEQNYRSTESILQAASHVIAHNTQRLGKELWSERGAGEPITLIEGMSERDEAAQVVETIRWLKSVRGYRHRDMAIFYRVNALSRVFEDQLRQAGVGYRVIGGIRFYDRAEVKDLLAYLRLCVNPNDSVALMRVINRPARGIGGTSLTRLFNEAVERGVSIWQCLAEIRDRAASGEKAPKGGAAVSGKARAGIIDLVTRLDAWRDMAADHPPHEVLERILRETNYEEAVAPGEDIESLSRRQNIGELVSALEEFNEESGGDLASFLERVALVTAQDDITDEDSVSLMSLHCAKGLEYRVVFMVGMEEPLFPSQRAVTESGHMEEERRLFYVGITRAEDLLFLTRADRRMLYGRPAYNPPSIFLREVPDSLTRPIEQARRDWTEHPAQAPKPPVSMRDPAPGAPDAPQPGPPPADPPGEGLFQVGDRVAHQRLGEGQVVGVTGQGDKRKVAVRFDAGLELELLERYGGLEPAGESQMPF